MTNGASRRPVGRGVAAMSVVAGFALALVLVYVVLVCTRPGQWIDSGSFGALGVIGAPLGSGCEIVRWAATLLLAAGAAVSCGLALAHRRRGDAARAGLVVVLSVAGCELMKLALPRPALGVSGYEDNTFPSGHVALAFSAALAIGIAAPVGRGRRAALGTATALTIAVSWASVLSFAHRPSDAIGAALVVGTAASIVLFGRPPAGSGHGALIAVACLAPASVALVATARLISAATPGIGDPLEASGWLALCAVSVVAVLVLAPAARPAGAGGATDAR